MCCTQSSSTALQHAGSSSLMRYATLQRTTPCRFANKSLHAQSVFLVTRAATGKLGLTVNGTVKVTYVMRMTWPIRELYRPKGCTVCLTPAASSPFKLLYSVFAASGSAALVILMTMLKNASPSTRALSAGVTEVCQSQPSNVHCTGSIPRHNMFGHISNHYIACNLTYGTR